MFSPENIESPIAGSGMDTFMVKAVAQEMEDALKGGKVSRIVGRSPFEIELQVRRGGEASRLFISADPALPIIFSASAGRTAGGEPDDFVAILRRHLLGGIVRGVSFVPFERIVIISLLRNEAGGIKAQREMVVALTGKGSNILLIDSASGNVIRGLRKGGYRYTAGGAGSLIHQNEPYNDAAALSRFRSSWRQPSREKELWEILFEDFHGLSPTLAREVVKRAEREVHESGQPLKDAVWDALRSMFHAYEEGAFSPTVYMKDGSGDAFLLAPFEMELFRDLPAKVFDSPCAAVEFLYSMRAAERRLSALKKHLLPRISGQIKRLDRRLSKLEADRERAESAEEYQRIGNLLNINFHRLRRGMQEVQLVDEYAPDRRSRVVPLEPHLDPRSNIELYFKRGAKAKRSRAVVEQRFEASRAERSGLLELREVVERAESLNELEGLSEELGNLGYRGPTTANGMRKRNLTPSAPYRRYGLGEDWEIYVGKNREGNDHITTRVAKRDDLWLHVRDASGSHVVIRNPRKGKEVPMPVVIKAASLAAYHSKRRNCGRVPVDYTLRRNVTKPKGAGKGRVLVKEVKTVYVEPKDGAMLGLSPLMPA